MGHPVCVSLFVCQIPDCVPLCVFMCLCLFVCVSLWFCVFVFVYLFVCLSVFLRVCKSVCLNKCHCVSVYIFGNFWVTQCMKKNSKEEKDWYMNSLIWKESPNVFKRFLQLIMYRVLWDFLILFIKNLAINHLLLIFPKLSIEKYFIYFDMQRYCFY